MTLIISNEEMNGTMKIVKSFKKPGLFNKVVSETINNKKKEQKGGLFDMLLCTLSAMSLGNILIGTGAIPVGKGVIKTGKGTNRVGQDF